jgi:hypothetical protein
MTTLLGAEHDEGAGEDGAGPLQDPEPVLGPGDVIWRVLTR